MRPPARSGAIKIMKKVHVLKKIKKLNEGWISEGFFVFEKEIFNYIKNDQTFRKNLYQKNSKFEET